MMKYLRLGRSSQADFYVGTQIDNPEMAATKRSASKKVLYYVHDPMCSWCWAFRPTWRTIQAGLPASIGIQSVLGGLAPDSDQPMPEEMRSKISSIWRTIQSQVPGTQFNFEFWRKCRPRRATYPACRAVIAATAQGKEYEDAMISAIQEAYYLDAKNPSDDSVLIELAQSLGLDELLFENDLNSQATVQELSDQIAFSRTLGAYGFPSLILEHDGSRQSIPHDYNDPNIALNQLQSVF